MRLQLIDPSGYPRLETHDECYYLGEYTARGGYKASVTNNQICNLKMSPNTAANRLRYKRGAIEYWCNLLANALRLDVLATSVTLVPAPCSKQPTDPEYDDRMQQVLQCLARRRAGIDVRPLIVTSNARPAQHEGNRLSTEELIASMGVDRTMLQAPLRAGVIIVDDVFTQGGTYKAMQQVLRDQLGVQTKTGVFLAKTVWPQADLSDFEDLSDFL